MIKYISNDTNKTYSKVKTKKNLKKNRKNSNIIKEQHYKN